MSMSHLTMKSNKCNCQGERARGDSRNTQLRAGLQEFHPGSTSALEKLSYKHQTATRVSFENITAE